ncbi:hypothetical protein N7513_004165 [Penicillium frequentans]|nr:hypothetical protein N7513_004165 [Penicillium glabrum]
MDLEATTSVHGDSAREQLHNIERDGHRVNLAQFTRRYLRHWWVASYLDVLYCCNFDFKPGPADKGGASPNEYLRCPANIVREFKQP